MLFSLYDLSHAKPLLPVIVPRIILTESSDHQHHIYLVIVIGRYCSKCRAILNVPDSLIAAPSCYQRGSQIGIRHSHDDQLNLDLTSKGRRSYWNSHDLQKVLLGECRYESIRFTSPALSDILISVLAIH